MNTDYKFFGNILIDRTFEKSSGVKRKSLNEGVWEKD